MGNDEAASATVTEHPAAAHRRAEAVNLSAQLGWTLAELENVSDDLRVLLADPDVANAALSRGVEELLRITTDLVAAGMDAEAEVNDGRAVARRPRWTGGLGAVQTVFRLLDGAIGAVARRVVRRTGFRRAYRWTPLGVALTAVMCLAIVQHRWWLALAALAVRLVGSTLAGGPAVVRPTSVGVIERSPQLARSLVSCLAGHLTDVGTAVALAVALLRADEPGWSLFIAGAGALAMYATMARVAAERSGVRITRSPLERVVRNGSLVVALTATVFGVSAAPALATFGAGMAGYAVLELARIAASLRREPAPSQATTFTVDESGGLRVWSLSTGMSSTAGRRRHSAA